MAKIAFFSLQDWEKKYILKSGLDKKNEVDFIDIALDKDHMPNNTEYDILSVFVGSQIDTDVISKFQKLTYIATRSTGFDHIDLKACKKKNIIISNVPTYGENTVAEHAFGLLLSLSKRIYDGYKQLKEEGNFDPSRLQGFDLNGKTLGVVGTGNIGVHSINIGNGFGMKVIAYDVFPDKEKAKKYNFKYRKTLEDLLCESDVVTLHVPYLKKTHHLINKKNIQKMKKNAVLINTSRGSIIETAALLEALKSGHLYGAGLDVVEEETGLKDELSLLVSGRSQEHNLKTILADHVLIDMPNVIMTPHSAFNTKEALQRILDTTLSNIKNYIAGRLINVVPKK